MQSLKSIVKKYTETSLILRIAIGIVIGAVLAVIVPKAAFISIFGDLFVGALKSIAPLLVAVLVMSSLCQGSAKLDSRFGMVIFLYMLTTFLAAFICFFSSRVIEEVRRGLNTTGTFVSVSLALASFGLYWRVRRSPSRFQVPPPE